MQTQTLPVLSQWASRHPTPARLVIILIELTNVAIGTLLGTCLWDHYYQHQSGSGTSVQLHLILLIAFVFLVRNLGRTGQAHRYFGRRWFTYILFCLNFMAYILAGSIGTQRISEFHPSGGLGSKEVRVEEAYDITRPRQELSSHPKRARLVPSLTLARKTSDNSGIRFGSFLLFLLGLVLSFLAAALSCDLACAGSGVAALMVFLLGTGILAGAFYFLGRALDKNVKLMEEMTPEERKREGRKYRNTWFGVIAIIGFFILTNLLFGN